MKLSLLDLAWSPGWFQQKIFRTDKKRQCSYLCQTKRNTESFYLCGYKRSVFLPLTASQHLICYLVREERVQQGSKKWAVLQYLKNKHHSFYKCSLMFSLIFRLSITPSYIVFFNLSRWKIQLKLWVFIHTWNWNV